MEICLYEQFESELAALTEGHKVTPIELLALIQFNFQDSQPKKCPICNAVCSINLRTGQIEIRGKNPCIYMAMRKK